MHYFDWTATTNISEKALIEYENVSKNTFGNPSSIHPLGVEAKEKLENCRDRISRMLNTSSKYIYFTSGGTESNSIILNSLINNPNPGEIITTGIEHSAILEYKTTLENAGWKFTTLQCPNGYLSLDKLKNALNEKVRMVCIMAVNNVVGTIQPIDESCKIIRDFSNKINRKIHIHCDAVQALGKIPFDLSKLDVDSAAFSSHKFFGPRGIGILYNRNSGIQSLSKGGGQELGLRPGTENLPAIAAMTVALEEITKNLKSNFEVVSNYHNTLINNCRSLGYEILSPIEGEFSPYILTISLPTIPAEVFLRIMGDKGFCLSAGSACSSQTRSKTEGVLASMNIKPESRRGAIRISLSISNNEDEINKLVNALKEAKEELK